MAGNVRDSGMSRRKFLQSTGITGAALFLGIYTPAFSGDGGVRELGDIDTQILAGTGGAEGTVEMNAWIAIDKTGRVTIVDHRAEMGQGSYQAVPQIIAEELEVDLDEVNVVFARGDEKKFGNQVTGGSSTVRGSYKKLLSLSATARIMLIQTAAGKWSVPVTDCYAQSGHVIHRPSGRKFHYGELVADASKLEPPLNVPLKKPSEYKLIRQPLRRNDTPLKTNGTAIFGIDKKLPGMLYAMVERNPRLRGKVKAFDDTQTRKVPGVKHVFKVKMLVFETIREGVAVVADSTWAALQGKRALKVEWDDSDFEHLSTPEIYRRQREKLQTEEGLSFKQKGDPDGIIQRSAQKLDVVYETPYQSHSAMEPVNCVAHYHDNKVEIWGPIQAPGWVQDVVSKQMDIPKDDVIVQMTFLGGGFGRKAFMDYPHEAAVISKEIDAPVQVVWTREDDATQGPFRPGISYRCEGVVSDNGELRALKFRMAGQNFDHFRDPKAKLQANRSTTEGFLDPYFDTIENISFAEVIFETPIPTMWWRSVYASTNGFAYESFMDELAQAAKTDPIDFRRKYLKDERCLRLLDKLEAVSGWKTQDGSAGYGIAVTECFNSTCGHVVKVSRNAAGKIRIDQVWVVMDCGWYVNPDTIRAQVEGSVLMGLGAATIHAITFRDGKVEQRNFYDYKMPRITDMPPVEIHIMENEADAGGVGEPGLPAFAPALTNAIFNLTGKRIRKLPFQMEEL